VQAAAQLFAHKSDGEMQFEMPILHAGGGHRADAQGRDAQHHRDPKAGMNLVYLSIIPHTPRKEEGGHFIQFS
jgi:hypothetical protein